MRKTKYPKNTLLMVHPQGLYTVLGVDYDYDLHDFAIDLVAATPKKRSPLNFVVYESVLDRLIETKFVENRGNIEDVKWLKEYQKFREAAYKMGEVDKK